MSVSAYYPVGTDDVNLALKDDISKIPDSEITVEKLKERWQPYKKELKEVSKKWDKPIFFIEIGVCSAKGFSAAPWTHPKEKVAYDGQGQARFYRAALETFWDEPWFMGFAWWAWRPNLYPVEKAEGHTGFCIYGKPAESVIRDWYNKNR
jgi:arabinogalactan endo-1,4-beta-galactosidase